MAKLLGSFCIPNIVRTRRESYRPKKGLLKNRVSNENKTIGARTMLANIKNCLDLKHLLDVKKNNPEKPRTDTK